MMELLVGVVVLFCCWDSIVFADSNTTTGVVTVSTCAGGQFRCASGRCIPLAWWCDSNPDCDDGTDEPAQCRQNRACRPGQFQCLRTKKCLPHGFVCDGESDCGLDPDLGLDTSDESFCTPTVRNACPYNQAKCNQTQTCIPLTAFCDGKRDCQDGSDEWDFCSKSSCDSVQCEFGCKPTWDGPKCFCPDGRRVEGTKCVDADECQLEDSCAQICKNFVGGFECSCVSGYRKDGTDCLAINVPVTEPPSLLISTQSTIKRVHLNGKSFPGNSALTLLNSNALEFSHRNRSLCYVHHNLTRARLVCADVDNLRTRWPQPLPTLFPEIEFVQQIALDWVTNNWYYLDDTREMIFLCTSDQKLCKVLVDTEISKPRSIALDPLKGFMFFTKWGRSPPMLERSKLDGSDRKTLISHKIVYPYGVSVDYSTSQVYWVDTYLDYVEKVDYDGRNRRTVMRGTPVQNLYGISYFERKIFVSSWHNDSVLRLDKLKGDVEAILGNITRPFNLHVFHRQRQPEVAHSCKTNNGGCAHICVPNWNRDIATARCLCSAGYKLLENGQCVVQTPPTFLLVAKSKPPMIKGLTLDGRDETIVPITSLSDPSALDVDSASRTLFFADFQKKTIEAALIEGGERRVLLGEGVDKCGGLAFDWLGKNLFWTDEGLNTVSVLKLANATLRRTLIRDHKITPKAIILDPPNGLMYFADWSPIGQDSGRIERAWMDGSNRITFLQSDIVWPSGLALDHARKRFYWSDYAQNANRIVSVDLNGMDRRVLVDKGLDFPYGLAQHNDSLFFVGYASGSVSSYDLLTKEIKILEKINTQGSHVKIFDSKSQIGENDCKTNSCAELCLSVPSGTVCACSDGFEISGGGVCRPLANYTTPSRCPRGHFKCRSAPHCVPNGDLCDGVPNCPDASDEDNVDLGGPCHEVHCNDNQFRCKGENMCVERSSLCDGRSDCKDGSDEDPKNCPGTCKGTEFLCKKSRRCVPRLWVCDGMPDCDDASDEEGCDAKKCEITEFTCKNKRCISTDLYCNGIDDCKDGSDEVNCPRCDLTAEIPCIPTNSCLPLRQKCNAIKDCPDNSDESDCSLFHRPCEPHEFNCSTLECIQKAFVCDGHLDCNDGSDEKDCDPKRLHNATAHKPISDRLVCDHPSRLCDNKTRCITAEQLCDSRQDCEDGTDEGFRCPERLCEHSLLCSHNCNNAPEGLVCSCPQHLHLQADKVNCLETHPCESWGICAQLCQPLGGRYKCSCHPGYHLQSDGFSCKSVDSSTPYVIFSNRHEIRGVDLQSFNVRSFISSLKNTIALDFFHTNDTNMIFWTDVIDDKIYRGTLVGNSLSNIEPVVQSGLATAEGLAVDWIGENLYWVESNLDQIEVARLNGSFRRTLVAGEMESPRAVALDPRDGWLFWTDWDNAAPRIERCSLAGTDRSIVVRVDLETDGAWPNGLTLDYDSRRIYWIDARSDSIHSTKYDGKDYHEVMTNHDMLSHPFAITLYENYVYWTDWRTNSVVRANKWNGGDVFVIQKTLSQPFDIQILHPSRQPRGDRNPCGDDNGGCSHLCLLHINGSYKCDCPHVMKLNKDNKTCVVNERVLLIARSNEIRGVDLDQPYYHTIPTISLPQVLSPSQIEFLASNSTLFWADSQADEVKRSGLTVGPTQTLIDTGIENPTGLAVDWLANLLFIGSPSGVLVCNLNAELSSVLLENVNVLSLAADSGRGRLFWVNLKGDFANLEMSLMDGSNVTVLQTNLSTSTKSLSYDRETDRLYYVSGFQIYFYDFAKKTAIKLPLNKVGIAAATVYGSLVYYADDDDQSVRCADKTDGKNDTFLRNSTGVLALRIYDAKEQTGWHSCGANKAGCQHLCLPTSASTHTCKCATGFFVDPRDSRGCLGIEEFIFYSINWEIRGLPLDGSNNTQVLGPISRVSMASTIDFLAGDNLILWTDNDHGLITSVRRDGTDRRSIVEPVEEIEAVAADWLSGLAVDWSAKNVYWSDPKHGVIEVARLDGSSRYVVLSVDVGKSKSLAVDPEVGVLVWAGGNKLEMSRLDGSNRKVLINSTTVKIGDVALDLDRKNIYFCDSLRNTIERMTYNGTEHQVLLNHSLENPVALTLLDDKLYWVDTTHDRGSIKSANINNLSDYTVLLRQAGDSLKDIQIFSKRRQQGKNACSRDNGGCEQLCLFNGTDPICACSYGALASNGKTCEEHDSFVMFSKVISIDSIHMTDESVQNAPFKSIKNASMIRNTIGLTFNYKRQLLFYSDIQRGSINVVHFNGTGHAILVERQGSVEGVAYEQVANAIYWTCNNDPTISRVNLTEEGRNRSLVEVVVKLRPDDKPRGIAVDSCGERMYWTNWNSYEPSIERAYLTGFLREPIITTEIRMPNALTLDHKASKLYWSDARLDKIERCEYDGSGRVVLAKVTPQHPFALAVYGDLIFWTDWVMHAVLRADKLTGQNVVWLRRDVARPMGIIAVANDTNDCFSNPCLRLNGGCEDICTLSASGQVQCSCRDDKSLSEDGKRCYAKLSACRADSFRCSDGGCIPYVLTCDGVPHCGDASDEEPGYCGHRNCPHMFQCLNKRCIGFDSVCNGVDDCGDGFDEENCWCNEETHFRCGSGACILKAFRCDMDPDCSDVSDEIGCEPSNCSKFTDTSNCPHTTACIRPEWFCDGENDCWDMSDEKNCTNKICALGEFQCSDGKCISSAKQCDGRNDCNDSAIGKLSSDEQNCKGRCRSDQFMCATTSICIPIKFRCNGMPDCPDESDEHDCKQQCRLDQFKCANNDCIPISWQCDGADDCSDRSDESEHCMEHTCGPWEFRCNSTGRCIPVAWVCDDEKDCTDNADEHADQGCHPNKCKLDQFQCADKACISKIFYCDGDFDCEDKSDEPADCVADCLSGEFACGGGKCVMEIYRCDGKDDCGDNTDEEGCGEDAEANCRDAGTFRCANGVCVNETLLCNGMDDCGDFSDEHKCHINECAAAVNPCAQVCVDKPVGFECACNQGYRVSKKDASLCEDVDECLERPCSQICRNTLGSFQCRCAERYLLAEDKVSCRADSDITPKLLLANRYYIRELNLDGHGTLLEHNLTNGVAIDYDWRTQCIYWSDVSTLSSSIKKLCNSTRNPVTTVLHSATLKNPDGLAVDWIGRNLYWCDKGLDTLEVSNLDGRYRRVILNEGLQEPRAVAIDPIRRYLYWTDWGVNVHIGKAGMDGSEARVIINESLGWPNALTIAYETEELFWADAREDYIAVADLNGGNIRIVASREKNPTLRLHHVFAITVWESFVYWTDWETKSIERCHKYHGDQCKSLLTTVHRPMDIRVVHPFRQPASSNPCLNSNCSTLCLLSPQPPYYTCACPENYILSPNGIDCLSNCSSNYFECKTSFKCIPFWWRCDTQDDCGDGSDEPDDCPKFVCVPGQFQCRNGHCVHPSSLCDGKDDCEDATDEHNCKDYTCLSNQFKCKGNDTIPPRCIPSQQRCDKQPDCPLGEDETDCPPPTCPPYQFVCDNGKCIPSVWVCDHDNDCDDNSDESKTCPNRTCPNDHFKCNSGRCIPLSWKCDGESDCSEQEDEPPTCKSGLHTCEPTYFKCNNNRCIPGRWRCDYQKDCVDGSDELDCRPRNCSESEFRCGDGKCIRGGQECDGEFQCEDRSDEANCRGKCGPQEFQCHSPHFCISLDWKCDGDPDCADASDEANCSDDCPDNGFKCDSGLCINEDWRCDGQLDCEDESDESLTMCSTLACPPGRMRCRNHRCVPMSAVCDNKDQCGDGSDEEPQMCKIFGVCPQNEFHCKNNKCIGAKLRCDGENDCGDNSDELDCVKSACRFGSCSQECYERKNGNYSCKCTAGFQISRDGGCQAQGRPANLVIAAETELRLISAYKPGLTNQFTHPQLASDSRYKLNSFDILFQNEQIFAFWTDHHNKQVQAVQLHLVERRGVREVEGKVVVKGLLDPRGLAVDWLGKRVYITDSKRILVATLDGSKFFTAVSGGMQQPRDIVVAPGQGVMFWADWGPVPRIETASMDGADRQILGLANVLWPTGLAVDHPAERLYWADPKAYTIESARFDGSDRQIVKKMTHDERPYKLDVFEDFVYFSTHNSHNVMRMNKFGHGNASYLSQGLPRLTDIVVLQEQRQKHGDDICRNGCHPAELCLKNPSGPTCVCPDGFIKDNTTCKAVTTLVTANCSLHCNSGSCKLSAAGPKCICPPQFSGAHCEHYRCSQFCRNKGMCYVDLITAKPSDSQAPPLRCNCPPQWTGERCETPVNICEGRCYNGATCYSPRPAVAQCNCPVGFSGNRCQNCQNLNCTNGGVCDGTACKCLVGYHGASCELSDCSKDFCVHGTCFITPKIGPRCRCFPGYLGSRCEQDSCYGHCRNGGVCKNGAKEPQCECPPQFVGRRCEVDLCAMAAPPAECCHCRNNGTCVEVGAEKVCDCKDGWGGETCEDYIGKDNNCTDRCKNGGVCQVGGYFLSPVCHCQEDWTGEICDEPIVCKYYCQNGGKCVVTDEVPHCTCPPAFEGVQCEVSNENFAKTVQETVTPSQDSSFGLLVPALVLCALLLLAVGVGAAYLVLRQKRPFAHERLQENDFNNPMYQERDAEPFALDADKSNNFVNPVYETVYNGTSSAKEEKTGLLQVADNLPPMTIEDQ